MTTAHDIESDLHSIRSEQCDEARREAEMDRLTQSIEKSLAPASSPDCGEGAGCAPLRAFEARHDPKRCHSALTLQSQIYSWHAPRNLIRRAIVRWRMINSILKTSIELIKNLVPDLHEPK